MALGLTQPLREMSTRSISWGQRRPVRKVCNLPPSCSVVTKAGNFNFLEPSGPVQACNGTALPYQISATFNASLQYPIQNTAQRTNSGDWAIPTYQIGNATLQLLFVVILRSTELELCRMVWLKFFSLFVTCCLGVAVTRAGVVRPDKHTYIPHGW